MATKSIEVNNELQINTDNFHLSYLIKDIVAICKEQTKQEILCVDSGYIKGMITSFFDGLILHQDTLQEFGGEYSSGQINIIFEGYPETLINRIISYIEFVGSNNYKSKIILFGEWAEDDFVHCIKTSWYKMYRVDFFRNIKIQFVFTTTEEGQAHFKTRSITLRNM